jgi:Kef-type K+ transport system membrane component KefB
MPPFLADSPEALYGLVVIGLFIVPRILQRFRLPSAIVALILGAVASMQFGLFQNDATINLFSTLGIVALFLFAGLEVDFDELRTGLSVLLQHLAVQIFLVSAGTLIFQGVFDISFRAAVLYSLAVFTPSTGFILDSLPSFGLDKTGQFWVKSKAIATEIVALAILFVIIQSSSVQQLGVAALAMGAMIAILPLAFRGFAKLIAPYAPKTEFSFLILVALVCAFITRRLGVYYLVGAFVVGLVAVRFRREIPALSSEKLLHGVELFASFFIPFYFFHAGLLFRAEFFTAEAIWLGLALLAVVVPIKVALVAVHRRIALAEAWKRSLRVGLSIVPTLVFTLVIGGILREQFALPNHLYGALLVYTVANTLVPGLVLHAPPPRFEEPTLPEPAVGS